MENILEKNLRNKYGNELVRLDIYEDIYSLKLATIIINAKNRREGIGTSIMNDIIEYADETKKIVVLTPSDAYGGNKNRLIQFYKRFGFKMNKGVHKNYKYMDLMIRYPKLSEDIREYIKESIKKILS